MEPTDDTPRLIMHIDMDAFFASVEQQVHPQLRNRPIAVTGSGRRTVITCPSYEARERGVRTGMTVVEARRACPSILLVPGCNQRYTDTCARLVELYKQYTPVVEVCSIDEAFLDVTGTAHLFEGPACIARDIKSRIRNAHGITASVGLAPNKLLAKIASDMQKPDGFVVIPDHRAARDMLEHLPVGDVTGIGPHLGSRLEAMGLRTCGELGRASVRELIDAFGVVGERLHGMALGIDHRPVLPTDRQPPAQSVGHSMTLDRDTGDIEHIQSCILRLSEMVGRRLRRAGCRGRTVKLTLRYTDFSTLSRHKTVERPISDGIDICNVAVSLLRAFRLRHAVRMLGVGVSNLAESKQLPLFPDDRRRCDLTAAIDRINERFGAFSVFRGSLLRSGPSSGTISPAWRPEGIRRVDYGEDAGYNPPSCS